MVAKKAPAKTAKTETTKAKSASAGALARDIAKRLIAAKLTFAHGTSDPLAEAAFIVGEVLGVHPDDFASVARNAVSAEQAAQIAEVVEARIAQRKPAAYLLNKMYMLGVPFYIDERAIVPRSYLGELLSGFFADGNDALMETGNVRRVLDLCTGSGCLAVLAALMFPEAQVDAVDLSADALEVARHNLILHDLSERITLHHGDLFAPLSVSAHSPASENPGGENDLARLSVQDWVPASAGTSGEEARSVPAGTPARYDLIITNPPYVDAQGMADLPEECRHEPAMAFDGGDDGIAIVRRIIEEARDHLTEGGGLLCEVGRCRPALEKAYPRLPFLWLDTEESDGEVFWLAARDLVNTSPLEGELSRAAP